MRKLLISLFFLMGFVSTAYAQYDYDAVNPKPYLSQRVKQVNKVYMTVSERQDQYESYAYSWIENFLRRHFVKVERVTMPYKATLSTISQGLSVGTKQLTRYPSIRDDEDYLVVLINTSETFQMFKNNAIGAYITFWDPKNNWEWNGQLNPFPKKGEKVIQDLSGIFGLY